MFDENTFIFIFYKKKPQKTREARFGNHVPFLLKHSALLRYGPKHVLALQLLFDKTILLFVSCRVSIPSKNGNKCRMLD